jgi:hypothetical protein
LSRSIEITPTVSGNMSAAHLREHSAVLIRFAPAFAMGQRPAHF